MKKKIIKQKLEDLLLKAKFFYNHVKYIEQDEETLDIAKENLSLIKDILELLPITSSKQKDLLGLNDTTDLMKKTVEEAVAGLRIFDNYGDKGRFIQDVDFFLDAVKNDPEAAKWRMQLKWLKDDAKNNRIFESILGRLDG